MLASNENVGVHDCQICGEVGTCGVFWGSGGQEKDMLGIYICSSCARQGKLGVLLADAVFDWFKTMIGSHLSGDSELLGGFLDKNNSEYWRVITLHLLRREKQKIEAKKN